MMRTSHHLLGAVTGLGLAAASGWSTPQALLSAGAAAFFAGGPTSPDIDNKQWWHSLDRLLPDEVLGHGGPLKHRGLMHWWGLPAIACVLVSVAQVSVPWLPWWIVYASIAGWSSHLVGDFIFGMANNRVGLGKGIPLMPWWCYVGVGLRCSGGVLQGLTGILILPAVLALQCAPFVGVHVVYPWN